MKTLLPLLCALSLSAPCLLAQDYSGEPIKATTHKYPDGTSSTSVTDPEKRTMEETFRDSSGKTLRKTVYPLNDQNIARGAIHYDAKGKVIYKEVYVFDAQGRIAESKLFTWDNQPKGKRVMIYEGSKNQARIEDYNEYGQLITPPSGKKH